MYLGTPPRMQNGHQPTQVSDESMQTNSASGSMNTAHLGNNLTLIQHGNQQALNPDLMAQMLKQFMAQMNPQMMMQLMMQQAQPLQQVTQANMMNVPSQEAISKNSQSQRNANNQETPPQASNPTANEQAMRNGTGRNSSPNVNVNMQQGEKITKLYVLKPFNNFISRLPDSASRTEKQNADNAFNDRSRKTKR